MPSYTDSYLFSNNAIISIFVENNTMNLAREIKKEALKLGFAACGIAKARFLGEEKEHVEQWLENGFHGEMKYMERNFAKRLSPGLMVDGAKSVISVLFNYYTNETQTDDSAPLISKYAYGKDYHYVVKEKLYRLFSFIQSKVSHAGGRAFVDSAPVLDKAWARLSGLGWIGKNSCLINPRFGSFVFIGELILDIELDYDVPFDKNYCGNCTGCIDACPTQAIVAPGVVDARKCISYLTIESKSKIPEQFKGKMKNRGFGCDICQDVCPWNRKALQHNHGELKPKPEFLSMKKEEWRVLLKEKYNRLFKKTPVERVGYDGLIHNINFLDNG